MLSVVIPALNEEKNLSKTVSTIIQAAKNTNVSPFEIIIVNDGSTDRTADIIKQLERENPFLRSIHNTKNIGIGLSFIKAVGQAKYDKVTIFPGDNYSTIYLIENLFRNINNADLIISYTVNTELRKPIRNVLSTIFCMLYMLVFDIHIKYINGSPVYPTLLLKDLQLNSTRYSLFAEINVKLLRKGLRYIEVDGYMNPDANKSSAIKIRNFIEVLFSFFYLIYDVNIKNRHLYSSKSERVLPDSLILYKNKEI